MLLVIHLFLTCGLIELSSLPAVIEVYGACSPLRGCVNDASIVSTNGTDDRFEPYAACNKAIIIMGDWLIFQTPIIVQ
jgi:hypothetical protein